RFWAAPKTLGTASPTPPARWAGFFMDLPAVAGTYGLLWSSQMPLVPRRQFGQEAAHGEGEGVTEQGLHLLEKAVAQEEPGGEEPPGQALAHGLRVGHHLRGDGEGGRGL